MQIQFRLGIGLKSWMVLITMLISPGSSVDDLDHISLLNGHHHHNNWTSNVLQFSSLDLGEDSLCRHKKYLPVPLFEWDTCAWCYRYMRDGSTTFGSPSRKLNISTATWTHENRSYTILTLLQNKTRILASASESESPIWDSFVNEGAKRDWVDCCNAARSCCQQMTQPQTTSNDQNEGCPPTWDGWQCWGATSSGITAISVCPPYIYFLTQPPSCSIPLEKECVSNGTWYRHPKTREEWTNYSGCGSATVSLQLRRAYVLIAANALSIIAILPALIVFFAYKQLRVHRIILHQNLFISMLLNGVLVIIFKTVVMLNEIQHTGSSLIDENSVACRLLLILTKYSRMTNYMWMFCEGFYLHKLIAAAFAEQKSLIVFYLIGWVFPIVPTVAYGVYRLGWANNKCWVVPQEEWEWVLNGPSLLSLIVNALFLINIIRVLVTKLRATHAQEPSQYRKAVRATLVLLPLFGLHFLLTIYRPTSSTGVCLWTEIYFYANDILDGIQGFLVALIFCYFNGEVSSLLKRTYMRIKDERFGGGGGRSTGGKNRRHGSLGRSVVSTHVYSSVPPSPEINCMTVMEIQVPTTTATSPNLLSVNGKTCGVNGNKPVNLYVTSGDTASGVDSSSV